MKTNRHGRPWYGGAYIADPCAYCNGASDSDDHITPRKNGADAQFNIVRSCKRCNNKRGSQSVLVFLARKRLADEYDYRKAPLTAEAKALRKMLLKYRAMR